MQIWPSRLVFLIYFLLNIFGLATANAWIRASTPEELAKNRVTAYNLIVDFDGTMTNEEKSEKGTFLTDVLLFPSTGFSNGLAPAITDPSPIRVNNQIFKTEFPNLATSITVRTDILRKVKGRDFKGVEFPFTPGSYYFDAYQSYKYYAKSFEPGRNYLLETATQALDAKDGEWRGKLWSVVQQWLELKKSAPVGVEVRIILLTARAHSREEWKETIHFWISKGHLPADMDVDAFVADIHNLGDPKYDVYGPRDDTAARKAGFMNKLLRNLKFMEPRKGEMHQVIIAENNQDNLRSVRAVMTTFASGEHVTARMTTINAGTVSEVRDRGPLIGTVLPTARILTYSHSFVSWKKTTDQEISDLGLALFQQPPRIYNVEGSRERPQAVSCVSTFGVPL